MPLITQEDGIVQLIKQPGATLEAGDILGILALDDPSRVKHAHPFTGQLPDMGPPVVVGAKPPQRFVLLHTILENILRGFDNQVIMGATLKELVEVLRNPELPYGEWNAQSSALHSRMPQKLDTQLQTIVDKAKARKAEFPAKQLQKTIVRFIEENVNPGDAEILKTTLLPLVQVINKYLDGLKTNEYNVFIGLLEQYYEVEKLFSTGTKRDEDVILKLREENKEDIVPVIHTVLSHSRIGSKNNLVLAILDMYRPNQPNVENVGKHFKTVLKKLTELEARAAAKVTLKAREVLIQCALPSLEERLSQMEHILRSSVVESRYGETGWEHREPDFGVLKEVVDSKYTVFDVLPRFFIHADPWVTLAALEVYVRRAYRAYTLKGIDYTAGAESPILSWDFTLGKLGQPEFGSVGSTQPSTPSTPTAEASNPFKRINSISDMSYLVNDPSSDPIRKGVIIPIQYLEDAEEYLSKALEAFPRAGSKNKRPGDNGLIANLEGKRRPAVKAAESDELTGVLNIAIRDIEDQDDSQIVGQMQKLLADAKDELLARRVRRVTFICGKNGVYPGYFTFRGPSYEEDESIRHSEPALAFQLELGRLSKFKIKPVFTENRNIHVYEAIGKGPENDKAVDKRYFVRAVVRPGRLRDDIPTAEYLISEADRLMNDILDALEIIGNNNSDLNHIFINFSPVFNLQPIDVEQALAGFLDRFGRRLWRLRVTGAEIRILCTDPTTGMPYPLRVIISNTYGFIIQVELYIERKSEKGEWIFQSIGGTTKLGSMHMRPVSTPYPTKEWLQPKRYKAHLMGTQYVYDFPELFRQAFQNSWTKAVGTIPSLASQRPPTGECIDYSELVLDDLDNLVEVSREPGTNTHGMVGWIVTARTPEYPRGRRFIIVANDITFQIGSFGPLEDKFFHKCTELARKLGIPRIYLSANSGARIGMADELIPYFSVAWNDAEKPEAGFKYLYLTPEVKKRFDASKKKEVITELIHDEGEERHKITTVIGAKDGLGVECLKGSGLIAGATSKAYEDIFTITLVTCRSVGIGAYLVRLGQRAIQVEGQPIILTGAPAINKLLGREVYTSNLQLGGTQIMYKNGVSHMTANDDFEGVEKIVEWMSFVPDKKGAPIPIRPWSDDWDRDIGYFPPAKQAYDPRWLIAGKQDEEGFLPGLFDKDSFEEALGGWARTVVVGRARLGGIPMGVIAVETRAVENVTPADPANPDSMEMITQEAGGVWYPNSAYKTAQALRDFNHGEQLPVMILANWRGFSGGQRDMYNEVLKYGSYIVDALVKYEQPIFVYIPPFGELRGGSWVVIDPTINPDQMEMYADEDARGGVLEPEGIVNIKYRRDKQLDTMARLDATYGELRRSLEDTSLSKEQLSAIKAKMAEREEQLLPVYLQIALQFADLHDRAGRMQAKNTIRAPLRWQNARRFFYWRLRRRLSEELIVKRMVAASVSPSSSTGAIPSSTATAAETTLPPADSPRAEHLRTLHAWTGFLDDELEHDDRKVAMWYEENKKAVQAKVESLRTDGVASEVASLLIGNKEGGLRGVQQVLSMLPVEERESVLKYLASA
jgi:acetyl-CoA carboxylase/biotin carboxylase 1